MDSQKIIELIAKDASHGAKLDLASTPPAIVLDALDLMAVMTRLYRDPSMYFDSLSCVTGIDNGVASGTMEVIYHLYSIPFNVSLAIKVLVPRGNPQVESVASIWKSANWLERETYDMYGIRFVNHPDLRRILMPDDWEGFPLRKDYLHQERYRNVIVKY